VLTLPSLTASIVAVTGALLVSSCTGSAPESRVPGAHTDEPVVTGEPAGYNSGDVAFVNTMIAGDQQGIELSALVPDRSTNDEVVAFAAACASARQSNIAILKVFRVQWNENPDIQTGSDKYGTTMKGMVDQATITKLDSLHGGEFDTLWLQSMIGLNEGAIEMANAEIANGKNVDAVGLAKQIVDARQSEIEPMTQILAG
jgi:uncharacterized protein (DUF305 family)